MTGSPAPARLLEWGEFAPWFKGQILDGRPDWAFPSAAGAPVVLFFLGSAGAPRVADALATVLAQAGRFDDVRARLFGVTCDPSDVVQRRIAQRLPGIRHFLDYDRAISQAYGACVAGSDSYQPHILVLNRTLQVAARLTLDQAGDTFSVLDMLEARAEQDWAPVLTVPNLLEDGLCRALIDVYDRDGGRESGFMQEIDGKTTLVANTDFKRRRDANIEDPALRNALVARIQQKLVPAMKRSFQFEPTRIERYIVAAYDADGGGYFHAHRDNTTKGTAHRRFAVTINLNDDYEGGDLRFPEFGRRIYRAPKGGAIVFSCSLLHEATQMIRGRRYATLPFLYDEAAAEIRRANNAFLSADVGKYEAA
ncbi:2OG-Fe(II) oxygenase [uncultured Sphingomonas sp.]|uniref:2OG-Fe(II) oxygenase n=1 Tax=uncultured Sphingomonas sp. TaxID=158754 RepID=UPI0025D14062|nr:2OG-Fe(II) oxygenase [uncultured Sphingomonas sp.]